MKCHTNDNSTSATQLPHKFSYIIAILGHNHFESPNTLVLEKKIDFLTFVTILKIAWVMPTMLPTKDFKFITNITK
jgi:hypothetical protein